MPPMQKVEAAIGEDAWRGQGRGAACGVFGSTALVFEDGACLTGQLRGQGLVRQAAAGDAGPFANPGSNVALSALR